LQQDARPAELSGVARYGIDTDLRLGLSMPTMRRAAFALLAILVVHDNVLATAAARHIQQQCSSSARWIAVDALREST
jgi:hypothetical protein